MTSNRGNSDRLRRRNLLLHNLEGMERDDKVVVVLLFRAPRPLTRREVSHLLKTDVGVDRLRALAKRKVVCIEDPSKGEPEREDDRRWRLTAGAEALIRTKPSLLGSRHDADRS